MGSHGGNRLVARFCDYTTGISDRAVRGTVSISLILVAGRHRLQGKRKQLALAAMRKLLLVLNAAIRDQAP